MLENRIEEFMEQNWLANPIYFTLANYHFLFCLVNVGIGIFPSNFLYVPNQHTLVDGKKNLEIYTRLFKLIF